MAIRLAKILTELVQSAKGLVEKSNASLLMQKCWVQAIYTELLHASSLFRAVREQEWKQLPNRLVKMVCLSHDGSKRILPNSLKVFHLILHCLSLRAFHSESLIDLQVSVWCMYVLGLCGTVVVFAGQLTFFRSIQFRNSQSSTFVGIRTKKFQKVPSSSPLTPLLPLEPSI